MEKQDWKNEEMKVELTTLKKGEKPIINTETQTRGEFLEELETLRKKGLIKIEKEVHYLNAAVSITGFYKYLGKRTEVRIEAERIEAQKKGKAVCHE